MKQIETFFVDTNYINRYLLGDILEQYQIVKKLFDEAIAGKVKLISSSLVFFEVCFSLKQFYDLEEVDILDQLFGIAASKIIEFENSELLLEAITASKANNLGIVDNYHLAWAKHFGVSQIKTFDKKLAKGWDELGK